MDANPSIQVVLSDALLSHLRKVAQEKHVPLRWLVAGLVCDTFESGAERSVGTLMPTQQGEPNLHVVLARIGDLSPASLFVSNFML
jgi:hypothetical protein